ncbi:MAG: DUF5593 domain-containing protein [Tomitella sp.]|nr:DUF5593 domain-containing protein [Tomitella sp.]
MASAPKWLLIETFGGAPTVIGVGSRTPAFTALGEVLRNPVTVQIAQDVIVELMTSPQALDRVQDGRRVIARSLVTFEGRMHGVQLWVGRPTDPVPPRPTAGAWFFNLTSGKAAGSEDLFDLYAVPADQRRTETAMAGAFTRLFAGKDQAEAIAKIVTSKPGTEHQALWTVTRDDDEQRAAHFSCRMYAENDPETGTEHVILRGVTHDLGPAETVEKAPSPVVLEYRVIEAATAAGEYRALLHPRTLALIRWMHEPMPGIAWERNVGEPAPAVHPDDLPTARAAVRSLTRPPGRAEMSVRVRGLDNEWVPLTVQAGLMPLDSSTMAILATISRP